MDLAVGSSIVLYLEDDFAEPDSIPMSSVYLVAEVSTPREGGQNRQRFPGVRHQPGENQDRRLL